jgi:hypothetical protein
MEFLGFVFTLMTLIGLVVGPFLVWFYGSMALRWGRENYPVPTRIVTIILIILPFAAACTIGWVIPNCNVYLSVLHTDLGRC